MTSEYKNIDEYISSQPDQIRGTLDQLRQVIKNAAPEAMEAISYRMPAFRFHGMLCYFAVFKAHYSLFVSPDIMLVFKDKLGSYELSKSAIRIPLHDPVPHKLFTDIIKYAASRNLDKAQMREVKKKKKKTK